MNEVPKEQLATLLRELGKVRRVAHDVQGPLQTVLGFSQLLSDEKAGPLNARQRAYTEKVKAGAVQLLAIIRKLDEIKIDTKQ